MQTFLPSPDFLESARFLDRQRLGKQRIECLQLLKALLVPGSGWKNHPAARMWEGYEFQLASYGLAVCFEWTDRGYSDSCGDKICKYITDYDLAAQPGAGTDPPWRGDEAFHASHRSNLLRKDPVWYGRFGWSEPPDLKYVWPVAPSGSPVPEPPPLVAVNFGEPL